MAVSIGAHSEKAESLERDGEFEKAALEWEKLDYFDRAFQNWERVGKAEGAQKRALKKIGEYEGEKRWTKAAFVLDQIEEHERAAENWEKSHNWLRAIDSWKSSGNHERLAQAYEMARERAQKYERDKAWFWAGKYWENLGEWVQAAMAWERDGRYDEAAACWEHAGKWLEASKSWAKVGDKRADEARKRAENDAFGLEGKKLFLKAGRIRAGLEEYGAAAEDFERGRAWIEAADAWRKAGNEDKAEKAEEIGREQLGRRKVPLLDEKWEEYGELGKAARSWSKSEWKRMGTRYESEGNLADAAHCFTEAGEWEAASRLWEGLGELVLARDCAQRMGDLERVRVLEKMVREDAVMHEREVELEEAAEKWESLNEWSRAAGLWSRLGEFEREKGARRNSAVKSEVYGRWYEAAVERKEIGDYPKAVEDFERGGLAKRSGEREFYTDLILEADVSKELEALKRHDWIAYGLLAKGAMGDQFALDRILEMAPEGEPYVLNQLSEFYRLAAYWSGRLELFREFGRDAIERYRVFFSQVLLRETKLACLEYIIGTYQALFVAGRELEDNELMRESSEGLRVYVDAYMKMVASTGLRDHTLRRLVAFYFLEENWERVGKLCALGEAKFGERFYGPARGLAEAIESGVDVQAAILLYSYSFEFPVGAQKIKGAFLERMWVPDSFLNSPEYLVLLAAQEKVELRGDLKKKFVELLREADWNFEKGNFEKAAGLYKEFLEFPLTVGLQKRVLQNLVRCASELKREKTRRRYLHELERID